MQLWPIFGLIQESSDSALPFTIGIYAGHHKWNNPVTYLKPYIEDLKKLQTTGMVYHSKNYLVNLTCVVCDAQARVFVKQVKSCAGYLGCDKCIQSEVHDGKKRLFQKLRQLFEPTVLLKPCLMKIITEDLIHFVNYLLAWSVNFQLTICTLCVLVS